MLVLRDAPEALEVARAAALALEPLGLEVLAGQRQRPLDDHVVGHDEVDLGLDVARVLDEQAPLRVDEMLVEEGDVVPR